MDDFLMAGFQACETILRNTTDIQDEFLQVCLHYMTEMLATMSHNFGQQAKSYFLQNYINIGLNQPKEKKVFEISIECYIQLIISNVV